MENLLLRNPDVIPSAEVLAGVLGNVYPVYELFLQQAGSDAYALTLEWNYYRDGKAWLCKVVHKKKTVCWLSMWDGFFQLGFYFLERHLEGIDALDIAAEVKEDFAGQKPVGKMLPMMFRISRAEQLPDLFKVVEFKKKAK